MLAPHPDDETLGVGATIMRKVDAGTPVHLVVATDGSKSPVGRPGRGGRSAHAPSCGPRAACSACPSGDVTRLPFVDAELAGNEDALVAAIAEVVAAWRRRRCWSRARTTPTRITPCSGRPTRRALAGTGVRLLTYPIWQFDRPGAPAAPPAAGRGAPSSCAPTATGSASGEAVAAYPSQMAARDDDPEGLKPSFLPNFDGPYEMFFPVDPGRRRGRAS